MTQYYLYRQREDEAYMVYEVENNLLLDSYPHTDFRSTYATIEDLIEKESPLVVFSKTIPTDTFDWKPENSLTGEEANFNRMDRNNLLSESDWTQMPDSPLTDTQKTSWATYRTALRNLPDHNNWPNLEADDWPTKPE